MKKIARALLVILMATCGTLSLLLVHCGLTQSSCALFFVRDVLSALSGQEATAALLWIVLCVFYARSAFRPAPLLPGDRLKLALLSGIFALVAALGATYRADDGVLASYLSVQHLSLVAMKVFGFYCLFRFGMIALLRALPLLSRRLVPGVPPSGRALRRVFFISWAVILCVWLPSLIARYPGALSVDAGRALQQFTGEIMWTADHPPAYTILLGVVCQLGTAVGGDNFGLFLCAALQVLALSGAMALCVAETAREGCPVVARRALTAVFALLPMAMGNAAHIIKDIPYAATFLIYLVCVTRALLRPETSLRSVSWHTMHALSATLMLLIRYNGALVVVPMTVVLIAVFLRASGIGRRRALAALAALPLVVSALFSTVVVPRLAYQPESTPDLLGVAFQQTARILKNTPQDVSAEDRATLDRLLDVNALADAYAPGSSDGVRKLFRYFNGHTQADVFAAATVCAKLAVSHPLTAFHAFWSLSGGFLDPFDTRNTYVSSMPFQTSDKYPHAYQFSHPLSMETLQNRLFSLEESYRKLPLISLTDSVGLYAWLTLIGWFLISRTPSRRLGWLALPILMTLAACLFSAGFRSGARYALPMVYAAPYLLCVLINPILATAKNVGIAPHKPPAAPASPDADETFAGEA